MRNQFTDLRKPAAADVRTWRRLRALSALLWSVGTLAAFMLASGYGMDQQRERVCVAKMQAAGFQVTEWPIRNRSDLYADDIDEDFERIESRYCSE